MPLLYALFFFVLAEALPAEYNLLHGPDPKDPMAAHIYQLDNGLTVYLTQNREEPRFYAEIAVRAGSKHDPQDATGIAHYLEHMLFKGSKKIGTLDYEKEQVHLDRIEALYEQHFGETNPKKRAAIYAQINAENQLAAAYAIPNELDRLYTAMGESGLNAHTWVEETVYKVELPANRLAQWAKIEAERFHHPVFRLFQTELETVYEEKNRSLDNKGRVIRKAVQEQFYKVHPYRVTTLGTVEHLKNPSLERMYEFYHTYYVPNNMAIFISGDIDIDETIQLIDREFALWERRELPQFPEYKEPAIDEVERVEVDYPGEEYVLLAFRTAQRTHGDAEALQILDMILDNATAGLINLNLNQQQKVREAGSYPYLLNDYGAQYLWGIPKQDQTLEEVEALLLEQIDLIKEGQFEDWIIPAIVTDFKKSVKQGQENNNSRVSSMRDSYLGFEEWSHAVRALDRMAEIEKQDIVKVANKYFNGAHVAGYRRDGEQDIPEIAKPPIDKIDIDASRQSAFSAKVMAMPFAEVEPAYLVPERDFTTRELVGGSKLYYARNPLNDLFEFSISIDIGSLSENRLPVARELLDKSGIPRLTSEELKKEWYKLGTDFRMSVSDQETTISIAGLDDNFAASLALLSELMHGPTTDDATLAELQSIIIARRDDALKDHRTIHEALYRYHRLGDMAYYRRVRSNEEVRALGREELIDLLSSLLSYRQTLSYTGSQPIEDVQAILAQHYPLSESPVEPPPYQVLEFTQPEKTQIYFFNKEMAQALVRIEYVDVPYQAALEPAVELFNDYFYGGMAGIVFQEIREARALAYSVGALYFNGRDKADYNYMVGGMGTQADKTPEAVAAFVGLLDDIPSSPERFTAAQLSVLNKYRTERLGFRSVLGAVRGWERKGLAGDPRSWRFEQIQASDLDEVLEFYRQHVQGRPKLISITGDKSKMDFEALAAQGEIVELSLDALFAF